MSYFLFIADEDNKPLDVVARMFTTAHNYKKIELSDYFLPQIPINEEKIIAAKKKFKTRLPDTAYTINVINPTTYTTTESIGIYYQMGYLFQPIRMLKYSSWITMPSDWSELINKTA